MKGSRSYFRRWPVVLWLAAISCALLNLVFYLLQGRRSRGGARSFALLLFTPAILCLIGGALLRWFAGREAGGGTGLPFILAFHPVPAAAPHHALQPFHHFGLTFSLAVLIARLLEQKTGAVDVAYAMALLFLEIAGPAAWMPTPLNGVGDDLAMVAIGGGASLIVFGPAERWPGRILVLLGAGSPIFFR
jgi:hypothetical protein